MPEQSEIDYGVLIDRLIEDFGPVKRLWPVSIRLVVWILIEATILGVATLFKGSADAATLSADDPCHQNERGRQLSRPYLLDRDLSSSDFGSSSI